MRLISVAAPLIQRAAANEYDAQKLFAAVHDERAATEGDERVLSDLVQEPAVQHEDLPALTPAEWLWFSRWKQALGGTLEVIVLDHLIDRAATRFSRYEIRALVLKDPETNAAALSAPEQFEGVDGSIGLTWLRAQAQGARVARMRAAQYARMVSALESGARAEEPIAESDALAEEVRELTQDALQCRGNASTFLLSELQLLDDDELAAVARTEIDAFFSQHIVVSESTARWYERGEPLGR